MSRFLIFLALLGFGLASGAAADTPADAADDEAHQARVDALEAPLYNPFTERYVLDELRQLRRDLAEQRLELTEKIVDRQYTAVDRSVSYATNTVTYFFYLIAGVSSILVLVGWTSIREIKDRVHSIADQEINRVVAEYETRLAAIEQQMSLKSKHIAQNREEIELTQQCQSLWLRAGRESNVSNRIEIYDQILCLKPDDVEALTYKADAVLELNEPQWAANLCRRALEINPNDDHAFYQLACALAALERFDEALKYLQQAAQHHDTYWDESDKDPAFARLREQPAYDAARSHDATR